MAKKHKANRKWRCHQVEISFGQPEPFALAIQTTTDGDRIAREAAQRESDKQHTEKQQTTFV